MIEKKCEVCGAAFEGGKKIKLCDICKEKAKKMPRGISYRGRVEMLKREYKSQTQEKLSKRDKLLLFNCSKCLWCRRVTALDTSHTNIISKQKHQKPAKKPECNLLPEFARYKKVLYCVFPRCVQKDSEKFGQL